MLTDDSLPHDDVPKGAVTKRAWNTSDIYPGTTRDYWVYVPAQYNDSSEACLMVFQDGEAYVHPEGSVRAPIVFDNLIHRGEMPPTIGIFINPGEKDVAFDNRPEEYVTLGDTYSRFLMVEILPELGKEWNITANAEGRAICGMSDGALCAFNVAWHRPDAFSKVISHIGSYTRLRVGSEYPFLVRRTRSDPKPIRVFLQDGENDLNIEEGSWPLANMNMASALRYARYDYRFEMGKGGHDLTHGGAIFPDTLRWLWRDYPGVKGAGGPPDLNDAVGRWSLVTNVLGEVRRGHLVVSERSGALTVELVDEKEGAIEVKAIRFEDGTLTFEYPTPESQLRWGKGANEVLQVWLRVQGDMIDGALSSGADGETVYDFPVKGRRSGNGAPH